MSEYWETNYAGQPEKLVERVTSGVRPLNTNLGFQHQKKGEKVVG